MKNEVRFFVQTCLLLSVLVQERHSFEVRLYHLVFRGVYCRNSVPMPADKISLPLEKELFIQPALVDGSNFVIHFPFG